MKKLNNFYHTLIHLKPIQLHYQLWYRVRNAVRRATGFRYPLMEISNVRPLKLEPGIPAPQSYNNHHFTFLNDTLVAQQNKIPWKDADKGRLWAYNLNYMDFLLQPDMDVETGTALINDFMRHQEHNSTGREPYTIALRGINWIKFLCMHYRADQLNLMPVSLINDSLLAQYHILLDNIEYHLMANHLLEDAFSLLFGAVYFGYDPMYRKAEKLLLKQLNEQILPDGAHFERSPMYHRILLGRLLDCINLLQNNRLYGKENKLLPLMKSKALLMIGWLRNMTFADGSVPLFNDAAPGIAPDTTQLLAYAQRLMPELAGEAQLPKPALNECDYRRFDAPYYCCIADVGGIAPDYQPGHAHADSLSFVLQVGGQPLLIDPGVSTYQPGQIRLRERSTALHNTVTVNDANSSEVWSAFRVGRRARVSISEDTTHKLSASHNGYRTLGTTHKRSWTFAGEQISIDDYLIGKVKKGYARFWLHPDVIAEVDNNQIIAGNARFSFQNAKQIRLTEAEIPAGYNRRITTKKIEVLFEDRLSTNITMMKNNQL